MVINLPSMKFSCAVICRHLPGREWECPDQNALTKEVPTKTEDGKEIIGAL